MTARRPLVTIGGFTKELPSGDTILGGNAGTVTTFSAGDLSPLFTTTETNPTTTPALSFAPVNQAANIVYAGPSSGGSAVPTFRALVAADIPNLSAAKITSGLTNTRVPFFNGTSLVDDGDLNKSGAVLSVGAASGSGEIRSYQIGGDIYYVAVKTASGKSGIFRSNTDFPFYYDTNTGETVVDATFSGAANILLKILGTEKARLNSTGMGVGVSPAAKFHVVSTTEQFRSGYDATHYWNAVTVSGGATTFDGGTGAGFVFAPQVIFNEQVTCLKDVIAGNSSSEGVVLTAPDTTQYRITVNNSGILITTAI
jgi:hypothetical protein